MKKIFVYFLVACFCLTNFTYAVGTVLLNPIGEVSAEWYSADEINNVNAENLLTIEEQKTINFRSGETGVQFDLSPFVEASSSEIVGEYFDDDSVMKIIEKQVEELSEEAAEKKANELISITNQLRALYRKVVITDSEVQSGEYYVLNTQNLDEKSGNLILGVGENDEWKLLYTGESENANGQDSMVTFGGSSAGNSSGGSSAGNFSGGDSNSTESTAPKVPENFVEETYAEAEDINQYADWEFPAYDDARSAEFKVVEKCWGEDPHEAQDQMNLEIEGKKVVLTIGYNVNFTYTFNLAGYYAQDTEEKENEALYVLTEHNKKKFIEDIFNDIVNRIRITTTDRYGREIEDSNATITARQEAWEKLDDAVSEIRENYGKIDVVAENYEPKEYYVQNEFLGDLENTVFAEKEKGKLMGIKTDEYNDIFKQHEIDAERFDVINSKISPDQANKNQYRFSEGNFYLCQGCSKCEICGGKVACGDDDGDILVYFSKYCAEHACRFVWNWEVDPTNSGPTREGLKCREKGEGANLYCYPHTCSMCEEAIVGVSTIPMVTATTPDVRDTGAKDIGRYSYYCAEHKCRAVDCRTFRRSQNTTQTEDSESIVHSPLFCLAHESLCVLCNETLVTKKMYEDAGGALVCTNCQGVSSEFEKLVFETFNYGGANIALHYIGPNAKTVLMFPGDEEKRDLSKAMAFIEDVPALANMNVICVSIASNKKTYGLNGWGEGATDSITQYLKEQIASGKIGSDIYIDAFSGGGVPAVYMTKNLHGAEITTSSGDTKQINFEVTFMDAAYNEPEVMNLVNQGVKVGVYSTDPTVRDPLNVTKTSAYIVKKQVAQNESMSGAILTGYRHNKEFVQELYNTYLNDRAN